MTTASLPLAAPPQTVPGVAPTPPWPAATWSPGGGAGSAAGARLFPGSGRPTAGGLLPWPLALLWRFNTNFVATHRESDLYARAGAWLAAHGGPAVSVAYVEVGEVGYISGARVIDLL